VDSEDSIFIRELTDRHNKILIESNGTKQPDPVRIESDIIDDPAVVPPEVRDEITKKAPSIAKARQRAARAVRRDIGTVWGPAFETLDWCMALADMLNVRLTRAISMNGDKLRAKDPSPVSGMLTGAYVKCLLLLGLYSKSCGFVTEISQLLRDGFPDGSLARLRTLHEHLVVMMVLLNDHTYEICERYQDSAVFEELRQLRTDLASLADPVWDVPDGYVEKLAQDIAEAELVANSAISRRGPKIKEQYEWARLALPPAKRDNLRYKINLADLEQVAGMDFFRGNYLAGNGRIHAGAYAAINHLDFDNIEVPRSRPHRDDLAIGFVGCRTSQLFGWVCRAAGKPISWETEEYDELLYVGEMQRAAYAAEEAFAKTDANPLPSS
jgi:hypothetical protein